MATNRQDALARAYAMLSSLRKNISESSIAEYPGAEEAYVNEYHTVLDMLDSIEIDVSLFRIPPSMVKPRLRATFENGSKSYSEEKYVQRSFILTKIDAILGYFEIITSEKPKKMGFRTSDNP